MPTYEYKCDDCGMSFEEFQSIKDKPIKECRSCKGHVKRVIHPAGIVFKGSGFHVTDYAKGKKDGSVPSNAEKKKPSAGASPAKSAEKPKSA